jgi:hypothetical protein
MRTRINGGILHWKTMIYGSSNWTSASANSQEEHNYFARDAGGFTWLKNQFLRKWNNSTGIVENVAFVPQPPATPAYVGPANLLRQPASASRGSRATSRTRPTSTSVRRPIRHSSHVTSR